MFAQTVTVNTLQQTQALATRLAPNLAAGDVLLLDGDLGAGKSAFSRALIQSLAGALIDVPSPTYTLVQVYPLNGQTVFHYDLYRIADPEEVYELEWEEALVQGICLVEWPSRLEHLMPEGALEVQIERPTAAEQAPDETRRFHFRSTDGRWAKILESAVR